jgi:hypothetical protein
MTKMGKGHNYAVTKSVCFLKKNGGWGALYEGNHGTSKYSTSKNI